jgi:hypothetical protein
MSFRGATSRASRCGWLRMEAGVCRGGLFWFRSWRFERSTLIAGLLARQLVCASGFGFSISMSRRTNNLAADQDSAR